MLKKIALATVLGLGISTLSIISANAAVTGPYITGQLGYADTHMSSKESIASMNLNDNGLAGHLSLGYKVNSNFAVEFGYLQLGLQDINNKNFHLNQHAIDLVSKSIIPVTHNMNVYGKLGVAYLTTNIKSVNEGSTINSTIPDIAENKWAPEVALGVNYKLTSNLSLDTSWTHIQPVGKNRPANIDFIGAGIGYTFG